MTAPTEVKHFLIVFHRPTGTLLRCQEFSDSKTAMSERFFLERMFPIMDFDDMEIVVLSARDRSVIKVTHSRYFVKEQVK